MDRATYERQKMFAGEKKPSMQRRCIGHDYTARGMYMITMVTEGRRPLFGRVEGHSEAPPDSIDAPRMVLSELGQKVSEEWNAITGYHPVISVISLQMMPDHLHGILFVRQKLDRQLGYILRGFKQSCNKHYRKLVLGLPSAAPVSAAPSVALSTQPTTAPKKTDEARTGLTACSSQGAIMIKYYLETGNLKTGSAICETTPAAC